LTAKLIFERYGTMNTTQYNGGRTADTSRGFSPGIWADCPVLEIIHGIKQGIILADDFVNGPRVAAGAEAVAGLYRGFASTGGLVADGGEWGGTLDLSSDGDDEGASLRTSTSPFQISRSHGKLWFEARVKSSTVDDDKHGLFVGLRADAALTVIDPIAADGTLADGNFVGFHRLEGDGDAIDTVYKANGVGQETVGSDAITIAEDTYVKVGFVFNPADYKLTFFSNGVKLPDTYTVISAAGTEFPNDVRLGLVIAVLNATATSPGSSKIDWWRCAQLAA
jgi:hypothetical protein